MKIPVLLILTICFFLFSVALLSADITDLSWLRRFGTNENDEFTAFTALKDGRILIGATTRAKSIFSSKIFAENRLLTGGQPSNAFLFMLMPYGHIDDTFHQGDAVVFNGSYWENIASITETDDKGFMIFGHKSANDGSFFSLTHYGFHDCFFMKVTKDFKPDASFSYSGGMLNIGSSAQDECVSAKQVKDGGYIILGNTFGSDGSFKDHNHLGDSDIFIIKLTEHGEFEPSFAGGKGLLLIGGSGKDVATAIQQTADKGYIFTGYTESTDGDFTRSGIQDQDIFIGKVTWDGKLDSTFGKSVGFNYINNSGIDAGYDVIQLNDKSYMLTGMLSDGSSSGAHLANHRGNAFLAKFSKYGYVDASFGHGLGYITFGGSFMDRGLRLMLADSTSVIFAGESSSKSLSANEDSQIATSQNIFVTKINERGKLDKAFGNEGFIIVNGENEDHLMDLIPYGTHAFLLGITTSSGKHDYAFRESYGKRDIVILNITTEGTAHYY